MRAVVFRGVGDIRLEDVPEPLTARIVHIDAGRILEEGADA